MSGSKIPSSGGSQCRFDSVAKHPECTDHSRGADSLGLFGHGGTAPLIANTVVQKDPDQVTEADGPRIIQRNCCFQLASAPRVAITDGCQRGARNQAASRKALQVLLINRARAY